MTVEKEKKIKKVLGVKRFNEIKDRPEQAIMDEAFTVLYIRHYSNKPQSSKGDVPCFGLSLYEM